MNQFSVGQLVRQFSNLGLTLCDLKITEGDETLCSVVFICTDREFKAELEKAKAKADRIVALLTAGAEKQ